jgi:hypothetical protein
LIGSHKFSSRFARHLPEVVRAPWRDVMIARKSTVWQKQRREFQGLFCRAEAARRHPHGALEPCGIRDRPREMMIKRMLSGPAFFLDANRVNAKGKLPAMNQLEKWHADGVIRLKFPEYAQNEAEASRNARRTRKAREYLIPQTLITTDEEQERLRKIQRIIFGDAPLSPQDESDALNVFTAHKYHGILVTADQELLQAADRLRDELHAVVVMTDDQAVEQVRKRLRVRDKMARADAAREVCSLPDWVGKD